MYESLQPLTSAYLGHAEPEKYKILFIENLAKTVRADQLDEIFSRYLGFVEVRLIAERGVAFVEFYSDDYAAFALNDLRGPNASLLSFKDETGTATQASINFGKK
jgi:RNA recognition motif-containing protein